MIKKLLDMKVITDFIIFKLVYISIKPRQFHQCQNQLMIFNQKIIEFYCENGPTLFLVEQILEKREMIRFCSDIRLTVLAGVWQADGTYTCPPPEFK